MGYDFGDISDDGQWLAFQKVNTTADSDIYLWNVAAKTMTLISKHEGTASYEPATFDADSKWLYYLTNDGSEFTRVRRYELASGRSRGRREGRLGRRLDLLLAQRQVPPLGRQPRRSHRPEGLGREDRRARPAAGVAGRGDLLGPRVPRRDAARLPARRRTAGPNNLYVYAFGAKAPVRLTDTLSKDIDPQDLVDAEVVRFQSFDGMEIPNIFYKP